MNIKTSDIALNVNGAYTNNYANSIQGKWASNWTVGYVDQTITIATKDMIDELSKKIDTLTDITIALLKKDSEKLNAIEDAIIKGVLEKLL